MAGGDAPGGEAATTTRGGFAEGLRASLPIVVGYLPAAVAFGVAARGAGLSAAETVLMSMIVFSGASQFALAGLLAAGASWLVMAAVSLVLGTRHLLYGPSLAPRLRRTRSKTGRAALAAFGLTDEVFAVASVKLPEGRTPASANSGRLLGLGAGAYASWVAGTWIGAVAGAAVVDAVPSLAPALSFALPALFVALLVSLVRSSGGSPSGRPGPIFGAVTVAAVVAAVFYLVGLESWSVPAAGVAGPVAGLLLLGRGEAGGGADAY